MMIGTAGVVPSPTLKLGKITHFASPSGSALNDGRYHTRPIRITDFWADAGAGSKLCLLNGTYTGDSQMVNPPGAANGVSGNPIVIKALHPGGAFINGQFGRSPVLFSGTNNTYITVQDINACCAGAGRAVYGMFDGVHDITMQRVVGWDPQNGTEAVGAAHRTFGVHSFSSAPPNNTRNILVEDFAAFGIGNQMIQGAFDAQDVIYRRGWLRLEGGVSGETISTHTVGRDSTGTYFLENLIVTYDLHRNSVGDPAGTIFGLFEDTGRDSRFLGNLYYLLPGAARVVSTANFNLAGRTTSLGHAIFDNIVAYHVGHSTRAFFGGCPASPGGNCVDASLNNYTRIGGNSDSIHSSWSGTNRNEGATLGSVPNPFNGSNAANLCFRWVNGSVTTTPLWPWPMDTRIRDAIALARTIQGSYGSGVLSKQLVGNSVTAEVESILGAIPVECRE